ncbi:collagenase-like [Manduca sexta]|uniref:collagenase-like n=1 Tax=Manduca sexta TaxID=7130 RepID=UPI00188F2858|nr:collagenase-like [Manduca sexta]
MKLAVKTILVSATIVSSRSLDYEDLLDITAFGYLEKVGIPRPESIRQAEKAELAGGFRIVGGSASNLGQFPYQVSLVIHLPAHKAVCGDSLLNNRRLLTATHCWWDGINQASRFLVVLGSNRLFSGGVRLETRDIVMHGSWNPNLVRNDIAMIRLPSNVGFNNNINVIALPSGSQLNLNFAGERSIASGSGRTRDDVNIDGSLNHVTLDVITNNVCSRTFRLIQSSNICTSDANGRSTRHGASGGPLAATRNNRPLLIGVTSFGYRDGCQRGHPAAFTRVTYYDAWIRRNL